MSAELLEGKPVADAILADTARRVKGLAGRGILPTLALVRVGDDPASIVYLRKKREACAAVGIRSIDREFPAELPPAVFLGEIARLNADPDVNGILVQFPLPAGFQADAAVAAIHPDKDVDGLHPTNAGRVASGLPGFVPCTPLGVTLLLREAGVDLAGKLVVVLGRSNLVGRPLSQLLSQKRPGMNATVLLAHSQSGDLSRYTRQADVLIVAMGRPRMIGGDLLKAGAVVVDVGINRVPDPSRKSGTRLVGDVDFESAREVASLITPVPGGVGPLTVACLCRNTAAAAAGEWSAF
jgi:methylenetetrahydrofolate dehydrogenase (NADP+) / methenyltetrahydrofolate cyclohydrolase